MENFFGLLKSELFYFEKFESIEDFREKLDEYIDYYNNRRIRVKLKGLSPVEYQTNNLIIMSNFWVYITNVCFSLYELFHFLLRLHISSISY